MTKTIQQFLTLLLIAIGSSVYAVDLPRHDPVPGAHSAFHQRWGMLATIGMILTAVSAIAFYWMAFVVHD